MAEKNRYPQIPSTVWWGVRAILQRSPNTIIDDRALSAQLNVQGVAAKQYISEMQSVGILDDDYRATELALRWRLDGNYQQAKDELVASIYPESLLALALSTADRQKAVTWFMHDGLGVGAAKNKAATYFLLSTPDPNESPARTQPAKASGTTSQKGTSNGSPVRKNKVDPGSRPDSTSRRAGNTGEIPLNLNLQIHISADASTEQIDAVFSAMRRYLYDRPNS